jgi:hypothetical protein
VPITPFIVPKATSPTIRYSGAEIPVPPRLCTCLFGVAIRKYKSSGNASEKRKKRRLRTSLSSS